MSDTILFSPCYLDGVDKSGSSRLERNIRYLNYYLPLKNQLGFEDIILADNHSSAENLKIIGETRVTVHGFEHHFEHRDDNFYPHCWRSLYFLDYLIKNHEVKKIVTIDSDGFVLTKKLAGFIRTLNSGWTTFWCPKYEFPDASIHILCEDAFPIYRHFIRNPDFNSHVGKQMERHLPFTRIEHGFNCDRYGETREPQTPEMDFYGQAPVDLPLQFNL